MSAGPCEEGDVTGIVFYSAAFEVQGLKTVNSGQVIKGM